MNPNVPTTDQLTLKAVLNPISQGAGTVTTGWVSIADFDAILAALQVGVLGAAATVDAKLQQATSAAGANAKDISGKAITQLVKATDDNKQVFINCRSDELDVNGGFTHVRLSVTVGIAASLIAAQVYGVNARYQPAAQANTVAQVV
ncbi:MAG TPA: hypothetical protein VM364_08020 [Vicinamibacterales bacterium]|nr:hypothetical protein [Vicinamibacterales bacterium]